MPDQLQTIVQRMVDAGESEDNIAAVIQHYKAPVETKAAAPEAPQGDLGRFAGYKRIGDALIAGGKAAIDHPVQSLATLGSIAAVPLTGGASLLPAVAAAGLGAAGGAGIGSIVNAARGGENGPKTSGGVMRTMATEGAAGAAGEGLGAVANKIATVFGRGLYRAAAQPTNKLAKYGDLVGEGLDHAIPVSKSGLQDAGDLLSARGAKKAAALTDADQRVSLRTSAVSADAGVNLQGNAARIKRAGLPDPGPEMDERLIAFEKNNPAYMVPSELEGVKSTLDNTLGGAYKKLRMREPLSPSEQYGVEMTQAQSRALEDVIPNYKQLNRDKMNAEGLRQMIARRVNPNGSGGNQGLENALTMLGGVHAIPARLAMLPPVLSRGGIALNQLGKSGVMPASFKTALIAALGGSDE